ncbi:MAG: hypothetical protein ACRDA5_11810, partial [Clostridium sp.]
VMQGSIGYILEVFSHAFIGTGSSPYDYEDTSYISKTGDMVRPMFKGVGYDYDPYKDYIDENSKIDEDSEIDDHFYDPDVDILIISLVEKPKLDGYFPWEITDN